MMFFVLVWWNNGIGITLGLLKHTFISLCPEDSDERVEMKVLVSTSKLSHNYQGLTTGFNRVPISTLKHVNAHTSTLLGMHCFG